MNKILKILIISLLGTAHYMSASNNGEENFQKAKGAWIKKFEENQNKEDEVIKDNNNQVLIFEREGVDEVLEIKKTEEQKQKRILETVKQNSLENQKNPFVKIFKMKPVSILIIKDLDPSTFGNFQLVCKDTWSTSTDIIKKTPSICEKILSNILNVSEIKDIFQRCADKTLEESKKESGFFIKLPHSKKEFTEGTKSKFFNKSFFFLEELRKEAGSNKDFKISIECLQGLICEKTPQLVEVYMDTILKPIFLSLFSHEQEKDMKWREELPQQFLPEFDLKMGNTGCLVYLNFAYDMGFITNEYILSQAFFYKGILKLEQMLKLSLKKGVNINKEYTIFGDKKPLEYFREIYENPFVGDLDLADHLVFRMRAEIIIHFLEARAEKK